MHPLGRHLSCDITKMNITTQEFPYNYKIIFILGIECSISKVNSLLVQEEMGL